MTHLVLMPWPRSLFFFSSLLRILWNRRASLIFGFLILPPDSIFFVSVPGESSGVLFVAFLLCHISLDLFYLDLFCASVQHFLQFLFALSPISFICITFLFLTLFFHLSFLLLHSMIALCATV